jgi:drug/metabolite transporter (DMT)-like permease
MVLHHEPMNTASLAIGPPLPDLAAAATPLDQAQRVRRGLWLAAAGVAMFALTLPLSRLAGGTSTAPQLPPDLVAYGRAAVAGLLSLLWLVWHRARWPSKAQWPVLLIGAAGVVLGFPLGVGWAMREVPAAHAAVVTGVLPLATALVATLWLRERAGAAFWACASVGCSLVLVYAWMQGGGRWSRGDLLLLAAVASAACGYVAGARLSASGMPPEQVICWMLVLALPVTLSLSARQLMTGGDGWQLADVTWPAWAALAYLALVSMWLGFFAWYRGLAMAGTLRASQLQLLQPFLSMLAAVPLLGEQLDVPTVACALAVVVCVATGQRLHRHGRLPPHPSLDQSHLETHT